MKTRNYIKVGLVTMRLAAMAGCGGYVDYGGFYDRGPDVHAFHD